MLADAIDLVSSGQPLEAGRSQADGPRLVLSACAEGGYALRDTAAAHTRRFQRPASAVRTLYRLVGPSGLSRAVASYQYRALFPRGSSLEWPPKPL